MSEQLKVIRNPHMPLALKSKSSAKVSVKQPMIRYQKISKSYGDLQVLKEIDFSIAPGEKVALIGPSGSGKTTLARLLMTLEEPTSGTIEVDGEFLWHQKLKGKLVKAKDNHLRRIRSNIGMVFQHFNLFPHKTVEKNIWFGVKKNRRKEITETIRELLHVLGIEHLLQKYPHQISGGEKQRVGLARALATQPSVLLLDEPLSALDRETRIQCQDELLRLHDRWKIPFIVVTHDLDEAERLGDRIIYLNEGQIEDEKWKKQLISTY